DVVRDQLKSCQTLTSQLVHQKVNAIRLGQNEQEPQIFKQKNELFSKFEVMTSQLKQYKDHVSQRFITDLSSQLNQLNDLIDDSKGYDKLNAIRTNLNDLHLLYYIHDWVYELRLTINTHLTPSNKNVSALITNQIRPLYKKLNNSVSHSSDTVKRIFSQSNYGNLMAEINQINEQIEQFCELKSELDNTQTKLRFESKE
ncbi:MAG: hypothetical protein OMM_06427, partial [Candidatus Magnetoglobus multicellularis str. Araruama]